jgi:dynein heavy chain 1
MSRDPASGTAIQEINFWLSMERALEKIDEQLKSDQISMCLIYKLGVILVINSLYFV